MKNKINEILDNDILPLIIAPSIFIGFVGLQWWYWYLEAPTPSPILLTLTAIAIGVYSFYKLYVYKKSKENQENLKQSSHTQSKMHQEEITNI